MGGRRSSQPQLADWSAPASGHAGSNVRDKRTERAKLAQLDGNEHVVSLLIARATERRGLGSKRALATGPCLVPGHSGTSRIARGAQDLFRHFCDCEKVSGRRDLGMIDIYASAVAGRPIHLSTPQLIRWRPRALAETRSLSLPEIELPPLYARAPQSAQVLWQGVKLLLGVEALVADCPNRPFPFSYQFACDWCEGLAHSTVVGAHKWLVKNGFLIVEHEEPTSHYPYPTRYYSALRERPYRTEAARVDGSTENLSGAAGPEASAAPRPGMTNPRLLELPADLKSRVEETAACERVSSLTKEPRQLPEGTGGCSGMTQTSLWDEDET
jgi:hypothetical protein